MDNGGDYAARRTIVAVFDTAEDAEAGLDALRTLGARPEDVSLMMRDREAAEDLAADSGVNVAGGAATGAISGGLLGGVAGWLVGIGALAIPGIGPVLGAGALAGLLTGAAIGAAAGGLLGALVGLGVPEAEAHTYQSYVREGRVLITAHADDEAAARGIRDAMEAANGYDVRIYGTPAAATAASDDYLYADMDATDYVDTNAAIDIDNVVEDADSGAPDPNAPIGGLIGAALGGPAEDRSYDADQMAQEERDTPYRDTSLTPETQAALNDTSAPSAADVAMFAQPAQAAAPATPAAAPPEDVSGRDQLAATPGVAVDFSAFMPGADAAAPSAPTTPDTDFRSGGDAARNATPEQLAALAGGADFAIQDALPTRGDFTPNSTETEYRSGGDATRGGTE